MARKSAWIAVRLAALLLLAWPAAAQFVGPTPDGNAMSVAEAREQRVDTYVLVTGSIVAHLRENYYTFRDDTGDIRVEIQDRVWAGRPVTPDNTVQILGEVDRNRAGTVYLWVKSLAIVE